MLSDEMLLVIRKRYEHYETVKPNTAVNDIRVLLNEIARLQDEVFECEEVYK